MAPSLRTGTLGPAEPVVDHTELSPSGRFRAVKQFGLVLLCGAWVMLGVVGHDPWKTEDATSFGVAWDIMNGASPLAPTLVGDPYPGEPLVYALAAAAGDLFTPWLDAHDAARLAVAVLLIGILLAISAAGRELGGRSMRWMPVLVFVGCVGLWDRAHQLSPELGALFGVSLALLGWAVALRRTLLGGMVLGVGGAVAFLSDGLLVPAWLVAAGVLLPVASAHWRTRAYGVSALTAVSLMLLTGAAWLAALASVAPEHLAAWRDAQRVDAYLALLAPEGWVEPGYLLKNLLWFTWPALPLALWTLRTRARGFNGGWRDVSVMLPLVLSATIFVGLLLMPEPRAIEVMPLLVPLSLLAALEIDTLPRSFSGALDWFGMLTFGLLAALAWWAWWDAYAHGMSPAVARLFRDTEAGYQPSFHGRAVAVCVFLTLLWVSLVRPARRSNRRAILNWAAGVTLAWALYMTIWLPYLDSRRTYRHLAEATAAQLPIDACVASRNLGEPQRALLWYFAGIRTVREETETDHDCRMLLVQYGRQDIDAPPQGWTELWEGRRRGDETERFVLYVRDRVPADRREPGRRARGQ
jgi:4-amino-4-deoxy-L-arabinose transferase-like glycosyltransferase